MTVQPTDTGAAPPRYSQRTLLRIKHARVTRDTILFLGGIAFIVYGIIAGDDIWIAGMLVAIIFGIAALIRGMMEPAWDRDWSSTVRYVTSIIFLIGGLYLISYSLVSSGRIGLQGSGPATNCQYFKGTTSTSNHPARWYCDVNVHWTDGTTTRESLESPTEVHNGDKIAYARPPVRYLFMTGDLTVTSASQYVFGALAGLAVFLQSLFSLCVLIFARTPPKTIGK